MSDRDKIQYVAPDEKLREMHFEMVMALIRVSDALIESKTMLEHPTYMMEPGTIVGDMDAILDSLGEGKNNAD